MNRDIRESHPPSRLLDRLHFDAAKVLNVAVKPWAQIIYDALALSFAFIGALLLRMPVAEWLDILPTAFEYLLPIVGSGLAIFWIAGFYRTLWRYASVDAVAYISGAALAAVLLWFFAINIITPHIFPWSIYVIQWMALSALVGSGRLALRYLRLLAGSRPSSNTKPILIYGAGDAGDIIARELINSPAHNLSVVGFLDDDPTKIHKSIHGIPIFGNGEHIGRYVAETQASMVVLAMPSLTGTKLRKLLADIRSQVSDNVELKTLPHISELVNGQISVNQIREFDVRDLLRRDPVELDSERVRRIIRNKVVFVSGAGGSIGSEICRQVAEAKPSKLIIFDISEASLYLIHESLRSTFPKLAIVPVVGDISHRWLVERVFDDHKPHIVFHAAAYKHVPLMEENPLSAVVNNVVGTRVLAAVSAERRIERMVMISTDKAVRPSNIMGATKRICELIVEAQLHAANTLFCAVRFGNVMGSSGSVIPKFELQIREGGPVTVTDRNVTRYFMLTSEAVQLVLQAASLDGEYATYFLDMGEPIRIDSLARDMIQLHGLVPDRDIRIEYSGLRPGEKLHEELCHTGDGSPTIIDKIWIAETPDFEKQAFLRDLDELLENCYEMSYKELYRAIGRLVPDFIPAHNTEQAFAPARQKR